MDIEPYLLSADEAATRLGISRRSLWTLTNREFNPLPCIRPVPGRVMYDPNDLRRWIEAQKGESR